MRCRWWNSGSSDKGKERTYQIPLPSETITHLALEAELQGLTMGGLVTRLMTTTLKK